MRVSTRVIAPINARQDTVNRTRRRLNPRERTMAGQPPEPSYQPSGQDQGQGLTQPRPAWQPSYAAAPPTVAAGGQQAYAAPPPYTSQEQAYPAQDQTYTSLGQSPSQDYQNPSQDYQGYQGYQGYQSPGYGAQQGQGAATPPPQWQGSVGAKPATPRTKQRGDRGLLSSLFDFGFTSMVTPKIIKALYILFTVWTVLAAVGILAFFINFGGLQGALAALIIVDPIFVLLSLGVYRVILEAFMVIFQIHGELKTIREQGADRS
jgi:Domain of unknown function (DUF4282)